MILYIPDYNMTSEDVDMAAKCLADNFSEEKVVLCRPDFMQPEEAIATIHNTVHEKCPTVVLAQGLAANIVLFLCSGVNRICISPKDLLDEVYDANDKMPKDIQKEYQEWRYSMQTDTLIEGIESETHPWCICGTARLPDMLTLTPFQSRVLTITGEPTLNQNLIDTAVSSIMQRISRCCWYDDSGVHFINYGCDIDRVRLDVFNNRKDYEIPSSVKCIHPSAFESSNLHELTITEGIEDLPRLMCSGARSLTTVHFKCPRLWRIGESCFEGCTSLKYADLSETNVQVIENYAFADSGIKEIILPASIRHCSASALPSGCKVILPASIAIALLKANEDLVRTIDDDALHTE